MTTNWAQQYEAEPGKIWVCQACGKRSTNRAVGPGDWDEACFLNSTLELIDEKPEKPKDS